MTQFDAFLIVVAIICLVAALSDRFKFPSPIAFVTVGIALAFIPSFPVFHIVPEYMLVLFLPLLLSESAYFTSIRDFKKNIRPISQLALGLVIFTAVVVAVVMEWLLPGFGFAAGMVLGAIIAPPDAVAATSITKFMKMPKRVQTVLEGESLVNDATGLVIYKFAVAAVLTGGFSLWTASLSFLWMVVSGVAIGAAIGWVFMTYYKHIKELSVEILGTLLMPYLAYIAAEHIGGSGVLAVVATGLMMSWKAPSKFNSSFRVSAGAVWRMMVFTLNALVFLLIGFYFPQMLKGLSAYHVDFLAKAAITICITITLVRFVWVYAMTYGTRFFFPSIRKKDPYPSWQNVFIVAWTGMRGVVTLATALALPVMTANEVPFPHRDLIIFLAFVVILFTLIVQGLTLPFILKKLAVTYEWDSLHENWLARKSAALSAMEKLKSLQAEGHVQSAALERITGHYQDRLLSLGNGPNSPLRSSVPPSAENHPLILLEGRIWHEVLETERKEIIALRKNFSISDEVMHELLREIDFMHSRFNATAAAH